MLMQSSLDFTPTDKTTINKVGQMLAKMWRNLSLIINGQINFGDGTNRNNIDGVWANTNTPATPGTNFTITHNLGRVPVGYWVMEKSAAVDIYTGSPAPTSTQLTLQATVGGVAIRLFIVCLTLLLFGWRASAQTTSVTLQVTDAGAQSWNNGIWTATLVSAPGAVNFGPPFNIINNEGSVPNQSQSGSLSATGGASLTQTPNSVIVPSQSQWKFHVCPQAAPSPCFDQFVTITNTGTQTVTLTPPAILINLTSINANASAYSTTEVTGALVGSQFYLLGTGLQVCSAVTGNTCTTWTSSGGAPTPGSQISFGATVSPLAYGAKWDGKLISDGATTGSSSTYTCPNSDCNFTSQDIGKLFIAVTAPSSATPPCNGSSCGSVLGQGFICTINTANSIVVGSTFPGCTPVTASATCGTNANTNCNFAWATQDDSTAINSAATAAWNNGNRCLALELPSGIAFFSNPIMNVTPNAGSPCAGYGGVGNGPGFADFMQVGPVVFGQGADSTILIPYNFNFAGCTFGGQSNACIGATPALIAHDFQISGIGQSGNGTSNSVQLFRLNGVNGPCTSTSGYNLSLNGWMVSSTGTQGFVAAGGCVTTNYWNVVSEMFGNTNCVFGGQFVNLSGVECFGAGGAGGTVAGTIMTATQVNSTSSFFGDMNPASGVTGETVQLNNTGLVWNSFGDSILGPINGPNGFTVDFTASGSAVFTGSTVTITNSSGAGQTFFCTSGLTCNVKSYASTLSASGANAKLFNNAGTTNYYDACANTLTAGGTASSTINIFGSCSITGTPITAAKLVLSSGWGGAAAWSALSGTTQQVFGTITASGTTAASPTIAYTFPTPFLQTPTGCFALQVGGTQAAIANPFTPGSLSATGVTLTYNGTPGSGSTLQVQIQCWNP